MKKCLGTKNGLSGLGSVRVEKIAREIARFR